MSVRESLNARPRAVAIAVGVVAVVAIGVAMWMSRDDTAVDEPLVSHYTIDDGKSFFSDVVGLVGSTRDGQPVCVAHVFEDADGQPFVGYLERFPPGFARSISAARAQQGSTPTAATAGGFGTEVKRPGDAYWVSVMSEAGMRVMSIKTRDGSRDATRVTPE